MTGPASETAIEAMMIFFMVWSPGWVASELQKHQTVPALCS
jgi:hypothetical protein